MFFRGNPVKTLGRVSIPELDKVSKALALNYNDQWVRRSLHMMSKSLVLKARTPSKVDVPSDQTMRELDLLLGVVLSYIPRSEDEVIVYADVSSLPSFETVDLHIDHAFMHILARRIHIPLITNPEAKLAFLENNGDLHIAHLEVGKVYEVNNQAPHAAVNDGPYDRWHILADVIEKKYLDALGPLAPQPAVSPIVNYDISQNLKLGVLNALHKNKPGLYPMSPR